MGMEIQRLIAPILQRVTNTNISKRDSRENINRAANVLKAIEELSTKNQRSEAKGRRFDSVYPRALTNVLSFSF